MMLETNRLILRPFTKNDAMPENHAPEEENAVLFYFGNCRKKVARSLILVYNI